MLHREHLFARNLRKPGHEVGNWEGKTRADKSHALGSCFNLNGAIGSSLEYSPSLLSTLFPNVLVVEDNLYRYRQD